jgi:hypothetical protein
MAVSANSDLRVPKERHYVQVHTHRFTVGAYLHLVRGASLDAMLSHLPTRFVPVTDATVHFIGASDQPTVIERNLMLVNRDHILLVAPAATEAGPLINHAARSGSQGCPNGCTAAAAVANHHMARSRDAYGGRAGRSTRA